MQPQQEVLRSTIQQLFDDNDFNHKAFRGLDLATHAVLASEDIPADVMVSQLDELDLIAQSGGTYGFTGAAYSLIGETEMSEREVEPQLPLLSLGEIGAVIDLISTMTLHPERRCVSTERGFEMMLMGSNVLKGRTFTQFWKQLNDQGMVKPYEALGGSKPQFEIVLPKVKSSAA